MPSEKSNQFTAIVLAVFRLNGQLIEWGNQFSQPHGLTSARWQVLGAIAMAARPPSIPQIAATMGVTRQGVLKQINLLADEGMLEAVSNPGHKRSPLYVLTGTGRLAYDALEDQWQKHVKQMANTFTASDLEATRRVLSAMSSIHGGES